jgi:hypothetical protein
MALTITCACGRPLLLRDEHAGLQVRCPLCGRQFAAPAPDAVVPAALPADRGSTYDLAPDDKPPAPPPVPDLLRRPAPAVTDEPARPRRKPPFLHRCFGFVWHCVDNRFVYPLLWLVLLFGVMFVFYSFREMRLAVAASETPQRLTLAQLAANGPGDNAHVVLTDFALCDGYVCLVKVGRFERLITGSDPTRKHWEGVFVPLVPLTPELRQRRARGEAVGRQPAPGNVRVLLLSYAVHGVADLDRLDTQPQVRGMVINSIKSLDAKTASLLRELYPGTDFGNCLIFQEGRLPSSTTTSLLVVFLGTCAIVGSGFLLLVRHLYRPPGY